MTTRLKRKDLTPVKFLRYPEKVVRDAGSKTGNQSLTISEVFQMVWSTAQRTSIISASTLLATINIEVDNGYD